LPKNSQQSQQPNKPGIEMTHLTSSSSSNSGHTPNPTSTHPTAPGCATPVHLQLIVNPYSSQLASQSVGSDQPSKGDSLLSYSYADFLLQCAIDQVQYPVLQAFLATVMGEPEVRQVLTQPVLRHGKTVGIRIQSLQSVASQMRRDCDLSPTQGDVLFVATLLHGIESWLKPCVMGNSDLRDVMFTIVRAALHQLDGRNHAFAELLRLCMGWGRVDEESLFL
jgi:hypothetical protein